MTDDHRRRILITGGLGFIGTAIIEATHETDDVLVVDNLHPQVHRSRAVVDRLPTSVSFIEGDVTDPQVMRSAASFQPTIVLHLAAETGTGQSLRQSRRHANVNVTGTATLLDALSAQGWCPDRFVLTSSRAVYGEGKWRDSESGADFYAGPRTENRLQDGLWAPVGPHGQTGGTPLANEASEVDARPANIYAATKLAQEHLAAAWCGSFAVPLTVLRLQNVYGSGQAIENSYTGVLTYMARQALTGGQITVFEDGGILRDFVCVADVADAILVAMSMGTSSGLRADIGSGTAATLVDIARILAELSGARPPVTSREFRLGDVRAAFANIEVAGRELGFSPATDLRQGLVSLLTWVEQELAA